MKAIVITVSALACIIAAALVSANSTLDTAHIIGHLCLCPNNRKNETVAKEFYGCYDKAPGKAEFVKCQTSAFGEPLSNTKIIKETCLKLWRAVPYVTCLKKEFASPEAMEEAVTQVNACQGKLVGSDHSQG